METETLRLYRRLVRANPDERRHYIGGVNMDSRRLQDRLYYGLGAAARRIGASTDAFRPNGPIDPLSKGNRFLRLPVAFLHIDGGVTRANTYGMASWQAILDASYTRPGDYLVQAERTFFIAAQQPLLPVLCIQANRTISISRPSTRLTPASNGYGAYANDRLALLMDGWPANVIGVNGRGEPTASLPTDLIVPYLAILVPAPTTIVLSPGDMVVDDLARVAVITGSELTSLGWRLSAKLATT